MNILRHNIQPIVASLVFALCSNAAIGLADPAKQTPKPVKPIDFEPVDKPRERTVPVRIYLPANKEPRPVVLYSHGLGGSRATKRYLGEQWSQAGYVCVFMQHSGSDSEVLKSGRLTQRLQNLKAAANWKNSVDRTKDVSFVIDQLEKWVKTAKHPLFKRVDLEHIGMSGHSFGAVTTLAVAGRTYPFRQTFPEKRIDAFLAMSPQAAKGMTLEKTFGHLTQPIFCMTGTKDTSPIDQSVTADSRASVYDGLPDGDKYLVVFDGAHHFTFNGGESRLAGQQNPKHHRATETLSTKFWDAYLDGDDAAKQWLQSDAAKTDDVLDTADRWTWK